jgi:D-alanine-D-alanine ligase
VKKLRALVLMHPELVPPENADDVPAEERNAWKTEYDVVRTLRGLGHEVLALGVQDELRPIRLAVEAMQPEIVFNLLEEFHGSVLFDHNVVSYLELLQTPYTGCNPRGMIIARGKALAKKLVAHHRIHTPAFEVFPRGRKVRRPRRLQFPLIVKSLVEHASLGISQASVVDSDEKLAERARFIHERVGTDAIAEQYIEGRELYVGVLGNKKLQTLPVWELVFENLTAGAPRIATARVKHDLEYQEKMGIDAKPAEQLSPELASLISRVSRRIYRILELDGYARLDFRLADSGALYFLEANPNPEIAESEEFASAARHAGMSYPDLIAKIVALGLSRGK